VLIAASRKPMCGWRRYQPETPTAALAATRAIDRRQKHVIRTGDTITNPVTGESVTFRRTSADSDGELVIAEVTLERGGSAAGVHVHPSQTETFRVVDGRVGFRLGGQRRVATAGETVVVEAGTAHTFWNEGESQAGFVCEMRPALGFERLLETMFALARDGKTNRRGLPHPLRLAAIADHHRDDLQLPIVPLAVQRLAAKVGATAGWALAEFGPTYDGPQPCADLGDMRRTATRPVGATVRVIHPQRTA
jgi:quercetin dioxygenase-like cupin family protein